MRAASFLAALAIGAAMATAPVRAETDRPLSDLPEKLEEAFRGLMESMKPALAEIEALMGVLDRVDSLEHYETPEILPNGDIILRRKPDAPPFEPEPAPEPGVRT